ncbi:hypothetical protein DCAR_0934380 [Daucus carota subsp. sativus]|uniref:Uncharacterized protein n=1 Tax=Daucus carota subsp. sativus TaxID=79200 RepID=A0A175YAN3_DAUCS|nr:hypothetical protein DCAR_0934380 [Daucus carota subsp. sativus]
MSARFKSFQEMKMSHERLENLPRFMISSHGTAQQFSMLKQYVVNWDMLLFTYLATGRFDLIILDHSRTEKMLPIDVVVIESDAEDDPEIIDGGFVGNGHFVTNILDETFSEINYGIQLSDQSRTTRGKATESSRGFYFTYDVYGGILLNGAAMSNGSIFSGIYSKRDQKIYGFMSLINKHDIRPYDKLLFVYSGEGCFKVHIFSASRVDKLFSLNPVEIGSGEHHQYIPLEPGVANATLLLNEAIPHPHMDFTCLMTPSNIDGSSHGPTKTWVSRDNLLLRTNKDEWTVGLVMSNGMPRMLASWNRFVRDNKVEVRDRLVFRKTVEMRIRNCFIVDVL